MKFAFFFILFSFNELKTATIIIKEKYYRQTLTLSEAIAFILLYV